jgi:hypothetical protein
MVVQQPLEERDAFLGRRSAGTLRIDVSHDRPPLRGRRGASVFASASAVRAGRVVAANDRIPCFARARLDLDQLQCKKRGETA